MIHVKFEGRCGNQLFQYAFARKLSLLTGDDQLEFNFYDVRKDHGESNDGFGGDQLQHYQVMPYTTIYDNRRLREMILSPRQRLAWGFDKVMQRAYLQLCGSTEAWQRWSEQYLNRLGIYYCKWDTSLCEFITSAVRTKEREKYIFGLFESQGYFDDIRDVLIGELTPRYPEKEKNKELYQIIRQSESVCVSFRSWGEISESDRKERSVCDREYYRRATEEILKRIPNAVFVVFSDDVGWARQNFNLGDAPVYFEDGDDEVWEKLRLMYSCKHFIMANSTFSWWAQYLSRNEEKIVISPDHWFNWSNGGNYTGPLDPDWVYVKTGD